MIETREAEFASKCGHLFVSAPTVLACESVPKLPWLLPTDFDDAKVPRDLSSLAQSRSVIRGEFAALRAASAQNRSHRKVIIGGEDLELPRWEVFYLMEDGAFTTAARRLCPRTVALLEQLPLFRTRLGECYFSILGPRTIIPVHTGVTNAKIRCHVTLYESSSSRLPNLNLAMTPMQYICALRVAGVEFAYTTTDDCAGAEAEKEAAQLLLFDDSFPHEEWNFSTRERVVLLVDLWHPALLTTREGAARCADVTRRFPPVPSPHEWLPSVGTGRLAALPADLLQTLCVDYLAARDVCALGCTCRLLHAYLLGSDMLWRAICSRDAHLLAAVPSEQLQLGPGLGLAAHFRKYVLAVTSQEVRTRVLYGRNPEISDDAPLLRVGFLGNCNSGTTSLLRTLCTGVASAIPRLSFGLEFVVAWVVLPNKQLARLRLWDLPVTEISRRFRLPERLEGLFVCTDLSDECSLASLQNSVADIRHFEHIEPEAKVVVVGTKADRVPHAVSVDDMRACAREYGWDFVATSSRTGAGITALLDTLMRRGVVPSISAAAGGAQPKPQPPASSRMCACM
eukprot:gnl/Spiro4/12966_TR6871_c0_g1_i1.p1 gnl/Spiro4/12966_TR6871_c0_g1~~gnl/Spiro4/12966_TR6871_c0_g1_i1.p1  ORF type:complete len:581 (-),score=113.94 gnl/Spiro4/12966_TR6871_c0_g1_i1:3-1706(-)